MIKNYIKRIFRFVNSTMSKIHWQISGRDVFVGRRSKIVHGKLISFGDHVNIQPDCLIVAFPGNAKFKIGMGADIGRFSRIACKNKIIIEENVFTGPNVFICDFNHTYEDINIPIKAQGETVYSSGVKILKDTWIGTNAVIVGNVTIGKHCVIGANSFVNHDVPDYCVAVGSPAKVVKKFDFEKNTWVKINNKNIKD